MGNVVLFPSVASMGFMRVRSSQTSGLQCAEDQGIDRVMTKSLYLIILAGSALVLGSCNTFIGMGRDIQGLGSGMVNKGHGKTWDGQPKPAAPVPAPIPPVPAAH